MALLREHGRSVAELYDQSAAGATSPPPAGSIAAPRFAHSSWWPGTRPKDRPAPPPVGHYLVCTPGSELEDRTSLRRNGHPVIALGHTELVFAGRFRRHHFRLPRRFDERGGNHRPAVQALVGVVVRRRSYGSVGKGHRFVFALGTRTAVLAAIDNSDGRALRVDALERLCRCGGIAWRSEHYELPEELVEAHPGWR